MEGINPLEAAEKIMKELEKQYKELKKLNVMVLGKTGVGKSTLINNMFSENIVETGIGKPVTDRIRKIEKPDFPLAIFDTPGLELGGENAVDNLLHEVTGEIEKGVKEDDIGKAIHCIWYCVSTPSHRFEQEEIDFIRKLNDETVMYEIPVIIVLTQSYSKRDAKELKEEIEKENLPVVSVIPVLAEDYDIDDDYKAKAFGLDKLSEKMNAVIPDAVKKTFVAIQCANIELKRGRAHAIVGAAALAAAAIGAAPIPMTDAAMLVPEQISMLAGITATFGVPLEKATFVSILSATIGTAGTTILGKTVVANLFKLIPGVGTVVGGVISATTAAALTAALGEAYVAIMVEVAKGDLSIGDLQSDAGREELTKLFKERLSVKRNEKGEAIEEA